MHINLDASKYLPFAKLATKALERRKEKWFDYKSQFTAVSHITQALSTDKAFILQIILQSINDSVLSFNLTSPKTAKITTKDDAYFPSLLNQCVGKTVYCIASGSAKPAQSPTLMTKVIMQRRASRVWQKTPCSIVFVS